MDKKSTNQQGHLCAIVKKIPLPMALLWVEQEVHLKQTRTHNCINNGSAAMVLNFLWATLHFIEVNICFKILKSPYPVQS